MTQHQFEEQLTVGLERLAAEADVPAIDPADIVRSVPVGRSNQGSSGRRNGAWLLAAAATVFVAGVALFVVARAAAPQELEAGSDQTPGSTTEEPVLASADRFAMGGTVAELRLTRVVDVDDLGEPDSVFEYHVYGLAGQGLPERDTPRLTIFRVVGPLAPPLVGDEVDLDQRVGVVEADGTVGFESGEATIRVMTTGIGADPVELAAALRIDTDGQIQPLTTPPDDLTLLGSVRSALFADLSRSVPIEGHAAHYDGDGGRWLTVSSEPGQPTDLTTLAWLSDSAATAQIGERSILSTTDGDLRSAAWIEDGSLVRVVGYGLSAEEIEQAVSVTAAVADWPEIGPDDGPVEVTGPPTDTSDLDGADRVLATVVPDGFGLILAADNADLGEPWYSSRTYVWASDDVDQPTSDDASILMTVQGSVPPFPGEPIDIAGAPGVLIDKEASNSRSELFISHLGGTATIDGSNVPIDDLIDLATAWVESGETEPPAELADGMTRKAVANGVGWQGRGGPSGVTGTPEGATAVYQDSADPSRVLGVASSPIDGSGGVDYPRWTFPDAVQTIDVAGATALAFEPVPGYTSIRFLSGDRLIVVWGENLGLDDVMSTARSLRAAGEHEWSVGL